MKTVLQLPEAAETAAGIGCLAAEVHGSVQQTHMVAAQRWRMAHSACVAGGTPALSSLATVAAISEEVAEEVPVALVYNGIAHAVMLATPAYLEDFACGFSLSERIVDDVAEIYDIEIDAHARGIEVRVELAGAAMQRLKLTRRLRTGKTGCGLCGIESLEQFANGTGIDALQADAPCLQSDGMLTAAALHRAMAGLARCQDLHKATGGVHAAGWAAWDGAVLLAREDVGRHNALDKLVGAIARQRIDIAGGFIVVTSRASFEMVQKAACAGIGVLAAVSAPTAMAIRIADATGVTLAAFVRAGQHVVYTHGRRFMAC